MKLIKHSPNVVIVVAICTMQKCISLTNPSSVMSAFLSLPCVCHAESESTSNSRKSHVSPCSTSCMTTLTWTPAKKDSQTTPRRKPTSKAASPVTNLDQKQKHSPSVQCSVATTSSKAPSHSSSVTTARAKWRQASQTKLENSGMTTSPSISLDRPRKSTCPTRTNPSSSRSFIIRMTIPHISRSLKALHYPSPPSPHQQQ